MNKTFFVKSGRRYRPATADEVCEGASSYLFQVAAISRPSLSSPKNARDFLRSQAGLDREQFGVIYLDQRYRLMSIEILFNGTIDSASVHPREVVKRVLQEGAAAVMIFHNHPSGIGEPSCADEVITARIKEALALIDVRLVDHLIIAGTSVVSLAERGLI
jgi:DNA repair protein RadC